SRETGLRRVLLDHQLRLVLRLAADATVPARPRSRHRIRDSRRADGDCVGSVLDGAQTLRAGAADAAESAFTVAHRAYRTVDAQSRTGASGSLGRRPGYCGRADRTGDNSPAGLRDRRLPCARRAAPVRWYRHRDAVGPRARQASGRRRRWRTRCPARAGGVRTGDAVLVAVRSESFDLG